MAELQDAVKKFASDLAEKINTFVQDVAELEVKTYTTPADQVATIITGKNDVEGIQGKAMLRAYTTIKFDGDTIALAPTDAAGEINKSVWELHQTMVKQAMEHRATMLKTIGDAAASALKAVGAANG
jgi:hypothetical protein